MKKIVYNTISEFHKQNNFPPPENPPVIEVKRANGTTRKLRSVGNKWAHFQAERFQTNTQPYYVLLSPDGKTVLNKPVGYTPDDVAYAEFLRCGIESYQKLKKEKTLGLK